MIFNKHALCKSYASEKRTLASYDYHKISTATIVFFFGLSMLGTLGMAAGSPSSSQGIGDYDHRELQIEETAEIITPISTITTEDNSNVSATTSLDSARQQYLAVWNQTEFHIPFSTYIDPGLETAYGVYEEHSNIFQPGEVIVLYLEPVAFGHQQVPDPNNVSNILYLMNFTADVIIADANTGNQLATIENLPVGTILSHRQNTELHITLTVTQDEPFPNGDYIMTYIVYDQTLGDNYQIDKTITIADNQNDNSSLM